MSNSAVELLRGQFNSAHETLEKMMSDVTADQAHWTPPGIANPLGATYAHIVASEDGVFNGIFKGGAPLMASSHAGKTGLSELPPQGFEWAEWGRNVQVDLPALKAYAQAVYAATDVYLGTLSDSDLGNEIDLSALGAGNNDCRPIFIYYVSQCPMAHWRNRLFEGVTRRKGVSGLKLNQRISKKPSEVYRTSEGFFLIRLLKRLTRRHLAEGPQLYLCAPTAGRCRCGQSGHKRLLRRRWAGGGLDA